MLHESIDQFRAAMSEAGLCPPEVIVPDGKLHRFASNGEPGDDAGWYVYFADAIPAGAFGDWRSGVKRPWRVSVGRRPSPQELATFRTRIQAIRAAREVNDEARRTAVQQRALTIWKTATPVSHDHPYLARKGVKAHGLRTNGESLVIPIGDGSQLQTLQFIGAEGQKRFLTGGQVAGYYFLIGNPKAVLYIVEGYATGASVYEATGCATAIAFHAGNLLPVARTLRGTFPEMQLIICADDDFRTPGNPGLSKAREAASAVDALVAIPDFGVDRPEAATDFNDLLRHVGAQAVRTCVERATAVQRGAGKSAIPATSATTWPEPQPMDRAASKSEPYPLDALPGVLGMAVREYQAYGQQPIALVASSALAVTSLAAQGLADVARDERLTGPISLNFLVIAQSGERKTAADKAMAAPLSEWERERADALEDDIKRSEASLEAWAAEQDGYKAAIKAAVRKNPGEAENLRRRLMEHTLKKPTPLIPPRLRYEDVNPQSLAFMLATGHPSAALWSDEGGMVTGSQGMNNESLLGFMSSINRLWDGGAIHHDRKQAQSVHLEGRRLTVSIMVQPLVLRELTRRAGGLTRGTGFLARFLVAAPSSTMGERIYRQPPKGMPCLSAFHERIRELLDSRQLLDDQGRLCPPPLQLSPGAFASWRNYHDEIERELTPLGNYAAVCDFAAKSAENAARIAGCLHIFHGGGGPIRREAMESAVRVARWYLREALRVLDVLEEPQHFSDARLLDAWLAEMGDVPARMILNSGPSPLRDKDRRDAAIAVLEGLGRARIEHHDRRDTLVRNPRLSSSARNAERGFREIEVPNVSQKSQLSLSQTIRTAELTPAT